MKRSCVTIYTVASILLCPSASYALQCRTVSGQVFEAPAASPFTLAVKGCSPAPATAQPQALSPLLRLYETEGAQTTIPLSGAPPANARRPSRSPAAMPRANDLRIRIRQGYPARRGAYAPTLIAVARTYDIDPAFLQAMIEVESGQNPLARSPKGAVGLMQVMPATARRFGLASRAGLTDPAANMAVGAAYLKTLQGHYGNNLPLVLAAYNAGEGAVERHHRHAPPYHETTAYIAGVLGRYQHALYARAPRPGESAASLEAP